MSAPADYDYAFSDDFPALCADCGADTAPRHHPWRRNGTWEFYMVHDALWCEFGAGEGYLCVGCLERRVGRRLTPADFTDAPINWPDPWDTPRMFDRKAGR